MKELFSQELDEGDNSLLIALANVLETLIDANKKYQSASQVVTKFQCSYAPDVSIISYLERIRKYAKCSDCCFVISLIYIDRMIESCNVVLTSLNVHRLLITSIMLAAKFMDDLFYNNAFYAKLGGVSVLELNALEIEFLQKIQFTLFVSPESYSKYLSELRRFTDTVDSIASVNPSAIINSTGSMPASSSIAVSSEYSPVSVVSFATSAIETQNMMSSNNGTWSYDQCNNIAPFSDQSTKFSSSYYHPPPIPQYPIPQYSHPVSYLNQFNPYQSTDQIYFNNWQQKGRKYSWRPPSLFVSTL